MRKLNVGFCVVLSYVASWALVSAYHVEPKTAAQSGWTRKVGATTVSQVVTACFDEIDSASGAYCQLFAGSQCTSQPYYLTVLTYPGEATVAWAFGDRVDVDHEWVTFKLHMYAPESVVRGKRLEFRFTRVWPDSLQFYYDTTAGYSRYGQMIAPSLPSLPATAGLAMRVYARLGPVDSGWCGVTNHYFEPPQEAGDSAALDVAEGLGTRWVRDDFWGWEKWAADTDAVVAACDDYAARGFSVLALLCYCNPDSAVSSYPHGDSTAKEFSKYPPRNLDTGRNYWAEYCASVMQRLPEVDYWEVWPEANAHWCWHDPDTIYYTGATPGFRGGNWIDTPRERCSLYVRMCFIAESVAKTLGGGRKILAGCPCRLIEAYTDSLGDTIVASGASWLSHMFDLAENRFGGVEKCFDIVSDHPYMWYWPPMTYFREDVFRVNLDTVRAIMRAADHPEMELWATEYGWPRWDESKGDTPPPITDTLTQADNVAKFMVSAIASQGNPDGCYDLALHYELTSLRTSHYSRCRTGGYGFLDTTDAQPRLPHSWAFEQACTTLVGKRFNGRVDGGDAQTHSRIYEFEDTTALKTRTWVCWQGEAVPAYTPVPARNDVVDTVALAYDGSPPADEKAAENSGWLHLGLDLRPGANDVRALAPGVYFVRKAQAQTQAVTKVVLAE